MTDKQPDALHLADIADDDAWAFVIGVRKEIAAELRRQYAEIETLRMGYAAARLEIESLKSQLQAPADAKALAEADRRAGEAERILATCKENVMRFEQVRSRMKYQWGADQRVSYDEVWDEALALKKAAQAAPTTQPSPAVQGDARSMLRIVADYSDWLDSKDRLTSFSTFVNEFGYEERDCKSVYEIVVVPCLAARAAQEGKSHG